MDVNVIDRKLAVALGSGRSIGFIKREGKLHIVIMNENQEVDLLWKDILDFHIRGGHLRWRVFDKKLLFPNNSITIRDIKTREIAYFIEVR